MSTAISVNPPPNNSPVADKQGYALPSWLKWLEGIYRRFLITSAVVGSVSLSGQAASIGATSISTAVLAGGMYRISIQQRVTRADNIGSSLTAFVTVTDGGITVTYTGTANTSNALGTGKSETFNVQIDASTVIKYGTTYATTGGAPTMQYHLGIRVEQVPSET